MNFAVLVCVGDRVTERLSTVRVALCCRTFIRDVHPFKDPPFFVVLNVRDVRRYGDLSIRVGERLADVSASQASRAMEANEDVASYCPNANNYVAFSFRFRVRPRRGLPYFHVVCRFEAFRCASAHCITTIIVGGEGHCTFILPIDGVPEEVTRCSRRNATNDVTFVLARPVMYSVVMRCSTPVNVSVLSIIVEPCLA